MAVKRPTPLLLVLPKSSNSCELASLYGSVKLEHPSRNEVSYLESLSLPSAVMLGSSVKLDTPVPGTANTALLVVMVPEYVCGGLLNQLSQLTFLFNNVQCTCVCVVLYCINGVLFTLRPSLLCNDDLCTGKSNTSTCRSIQGLFPGIIIHVHVV